MLIPRLGAGLAGHAVRPRLDDPGLPTRARRPQRHAGPDAHLPRGDGRLGACPARSTSAATPSWGRRCSSSATTSSRRWPPRPSGATPCGAWACPSPTPARTWPTSRPAPWLDGDTFVVNGQKVWTSYAMVRSQVLLLRAHRPRRGPKHKGISVLIIDMDTPGIEVRPLHHLSGAAEFAEVFFTDVIVPRANLVGELNDGWRITMGSLAHERAGALGRGRGAARAGHRRPGRAGPRARAWPTTRWCGAASAEVAAACRALRAMGYKGFASFAQGISAPEHSFMKMATSEVRKAHLRAGHRPPGRRTGRSSTEQSRPRAVAGSLVAHRGLATPSAADRARSSATSSPSVSSDSPADEGHGLDFALTDEQELLPVDSTTRVARRRVPDRRWCARTWTRPGGRGAAMGPPAEFSALGRRSGGRPLRVHGGARLRRARRRRSSAPRCLRSPAGSGRIGPPRSAIDAASRPRRWPSPGRTASGSLNDGPLQELRARRRDRGRRARGGRVRGRRRALEEPELHRLETIDPSRPLLRRARRRRRGR